MGAERGYDRSPPFSLLGKPIPPAFELRAIVIAAGHARAYDETEWRDAIVVVERGEVELEGRGGSLRFGRGDVLCLDGLSLSSLRNRGAEPTVLVAVRRRTGHR